MPVAEEATKKLKKRKKKQPNPLSCKKKKKKIASNIGTSGRSATSTSNKKSNIDGIQEKTIEKKTKRKRIKLPTHIKEMLNS